MGEGSQDDDGRLVTVREAAAVTGRSPETVRRWVWAGKLEARRQGHRLLVSRSEALALGAAGSPVLSSSLVAWAAAAKKSLAAFEHRELSSAADLVLNDRRERSRAPR